jgi:uncharacterized phage-associated protein
MIALGRQSVSVIIFVAIEIKLGYDMFVVCSKTETLYLVEEVQIVGYTAQHVANFFLEKAAETENNLTPMKLIKLVYIGYGWYLALIGKKLFNENIEAWQHGPVIPSLYHEFKHFGSNRIKTMATTYDFETMDLTEPHIPESDSTANLILNKVWAAYCQFSGWALRDKTHENGTPWSMTFSQNGSGEVIADDLIKPHFKSKISEILSATAG